MKKRNKIGQLSNGATVWDYGEYRGGDFGVDDTLQLMRDYIHKDKHNPEIVSLAKNIAPKGSEITVLKSLFNWVVNNITYIDDGDNPIVQQYAPVNREEDVRHEFVQTPSNLLKTRLGDCDDMTTLFACLCYARGFKKIYAKVIAWKWKNRKIGDPFSHVFNMVYLPEANVTIPCDVVMGVSGFGNEKTPTFRQKIYRFVV